MRGWMMMLIRVKECGDVYVWSIKSCLSYVGFFTASRVFRVGFASAK